MTEIPSIGKVPGLPKIAAKKLAQQTQDGSTVARAGDSVQLSPEAKLQSKIAELKDQAATLPDVREDKIAEIRTAIEDESYITEEKIDVVLDRLAEDIFG